MTRDDIIKMAREAYGDWCPNAVPPELERFAALVQQHLIAFGYRKCAEGQRTTQFCGLLEAAVRDEMEACARVCDDILREGKCTGASDAAIECSVSIRARGAND